LSVISARWVHKVLKDCGHFSVHRPELSTGLRKLFLERTQPAFG
jgi:hypothetical protein